MRSKEDERARWMVAAQQGDAGAYESLLRSLLPVMRAFVRRRGIDASQVEDVVQEVLLRVHRARHTWRPERPFDPWMLAITRNPSSCSRHGSPNRGWSRHWGRFWPLELLQVGQLSAAEAAARAAVTNAASESPDLRHLPVAVTTAPSAATAIAPSASDACGCRRQPPS